ncbi:Lrp/AsnC family transcriptional regulator [Pedobacter caeni]|uniref:DNA-binding transcriptional regulator, Lrp family n=1 Tax=Pedobacter caeni TaxID=288992 RepID=A0A1M5L2Q0_9SPHI|nr:Lrp/AsnC family transcriptional regulator [Pedobacter caeni]SHG59215.1 DNA-binding transcriptional regulator, Lrp family [Pedobacter caeni]
MAAQTEQVGQPPIVLDDKDYEILRLLQENSKLTIREIASKVHLSPTPTHERIKRLEREGVIRKYVALLDNRKINKGITVIVQISLKEHNKRAAQEFIDAVLEFKEVTECYNISGDFDFMLKIVVESMGSFHYFSVNKLSEISGIAQTKSIFVMDTIKETPLLL